MSRNEKGIAANDALNNNLKTQLTMKYDTPKQQKFQFKISNYKTPHLLLDFSLFATLSSSCVSIVINLLPFSQQEIIFP